MIKITTEKAIRERIAKELCEADNFRYINERISRLEDKVWELENATTKELVNDGRTANDKMIVTTARGQKI